MSRNNLGWDPSGSNFFGQYLKWPQTLLFPASFQILVFKLYLISYLNIIAYTLVIFEKQLFFEQSLELIKSKSNNDRAYRSLDRVIIHLIQTIKSQSMKNLWKAVPLWSICPNERQSQVYELRGKSWRNFCLGLKSHQSDRNGNTEVLAFFGTIKEVYDPKTAESSFICQPTGTFEDMWPVLKSKD